MTAVAPAGMVGWPVTTPRELVWVRYMVFGLEYAGVEMLLLLDCLRQHCQRIDRGRYHIEQLRLTDSDCA